jgi:NAD(P)-dependent dehydrogenase (short-subunit alcohol dehydrogenase family)
LFLHEQAILVPPQKSSFGPDGAYVIAGGFGGLGRDIARWLASKGAKHLVLLSRSGPRAESAQKLLADMKAIGVNCIAPACDISDRTALATTLEALKDSVPQIRGCFQATMVLRVSRYQPYLLGFMTNASARVKCSWIWHILTG